MSERVLIYTKVDYIPNMKPGKRYEAVKHNEGYRFKGESGDAEFLFDHRIKEESINKVDEASKPEDGKKFDEKKPKMHLLPVVALYPVVKVLEFGAKKYGEFNWHDLRFRNGKQRCFNAMMRHWAEIQDGNLYDEESGLLHMAHIGCNVLFWLYFHIKDGLPTSKED